MAANKPDAFLNSYIDTPKSVLQRFRANYYECFYNPFGLRADISCVKEVSNSSGLVAVILNPGFDKRYAIPEIS